MSQQQQCHKQIVLPPLCMPPQSFPQPCCPPCFYPPPCFPCCPPNPCCPPQPCCPPPCAPCCPPPCCQTPCVPCCPKVPCAPCCPPKCGSSCPPKSRCNCCGGRSTVICVPRGAPPPCPCPCPCRPQCPCPCPCPCPCRPQCCGDSGGGGGSGGDKPASFNNCNFYCSELPKSFGGGGGGGNGGACPEDDCCPQQPECCPDGGFDDCDNGPYNRAAGDDQLAPVPRGTPRRFYSPVTRSRPTKKNPDGWQYKSNKQQRRTKGKGGRPFRGGGKTRQNVNDDDEDDPFDENGDDDQQDSQYSGNDHNDDQRYAQRIPPPPRPPRGASLIKKKNDYLDQERVSLTDSVPYCDHPSMMMEQQPSFFTCCQTTATTNSFRGSANPSLMVKNPESTTTTGKGQSGGDRVNAQTTTIISIDNDSLLANKTIKNCVDAWSGLKKITKFSAKTRTANGCDPSKPVDDKIEEMDKAATAPPQSVKLPTTTGAGQNGTFVRSASNKNKGKVVTLSGMEVHSQPREKITKLSTDPTNTTTPGKTRLGGNARRKFKSPVSKKMIDEDPNQNGEGRKTIDIVDLGSKKETKMDKLLWSLIPTAAVSNKNGQKTPLSTLNIFGPSSNCPENASSDLISAPPTQPYPKPLDDCKPIEIQSGPMAQTTNELTTLLKNHGRGRRPRSCDSHYERKAGRQEDPKEGDGGNGWRAMTATTTCGGECGQSLSFNDHHDIPMIELCQDLIVDTTGDQQKSIVRDTLAAILKKKPPLPPLRCKGLDQVNFARQDFCVMTCFVGGGGGVKSGQTGCSSNRRHDCPPPVIIIPPSATFSPAQWTNFQFNSTPSSHLTGCSPCAPCRCSCPCPRGVSMSEKCGKSRKNRTKPPFDTSMKEPKHFFQERSCHNSRSRSPSPCFLSQNFCSTFPCCSGQCPMVYGHNNCQEFVGRPGPGSPFTPCSMSPHYHRCPSTSGREGYSSRNNPAIIPFGDPKIKTDLVNFEEGSRPATAPHSRAHFDNNENENEYLGKKTPPPPRPPPPVPPRRPPPPPKKNSSSKVTSSSHVSAKNSRSSVPMKKLFESQMNQFSRSSSPRVERTKEHSKSKMGGHHSSHICLPKITSADPSGQTWDPCYVNCLSPGRPPSPCQVLPPLCAPPPSLSIMPPYPYGMKRPPRYPQPPLVLPPISPRHDPPPLDPVTREKTKKATAESWDTGSPPPQNQKWVNSPPNKYFQFVPGLPHDDCCGPMPMDERERRKMKKARRRGCDCSNNKDNNNNNFKKLPIRQACCDPDECCCDLSYCCDPCSQNFSRKPNSYCPPCC